MLITLKQPRPLPPPLPPPPLGAELELADHELLVELELQSSDGLVDLAAGVLLLLPQSSEVDFEALLLEAPQSSVVVLVPQSLLVVVLAAVGVELVPPLVQASASQSEVPEGVADLLAVAGSASTEAQESASLLVAAATTGALASAPQSSITTGAED